MHETYVDVLPAALAVSPSPLLALDGQPVTVTLTTQVRDGGNVDVEDTSARFWVGDPGASIGSVRVVPGVSARLFLLVVLHVGVAPPSSPGKLGVFHALAVIGLDLLGGIARWGWPMVQCSMCWFTCRRLHSV